MSNSTRPQWNSSLTFLLAMIGSAVGLGNIWRFPYVMYTNGGGSFIVPYVIAIAVVGFSFLLLEYAIGYKFKESVYNIYRKIKPQLEIISWFAVVLVFFIVSYYVVIIGWDVIYFVLSFFKGWGANPVAFFSNDVLHATDSISGIFQIVPIVFIATLFVWAFIWIISSRDLNDGIGKFSKVVIPLLFALVCVIVFYSLTLPGAFIGVSAMFTPDWASLANPQIWIAACGQIIFSLSLGMAITITYSSYLQEGANITKNAVVVLFSNSGFEVFNAVGIFSILGFMTAASGIPLDQLVVDGTGLAFVAFPQVFNIMGPFAYVIGPIFFMCIFIAGITSAIALVEPISASISEKFGLSRKKATTIICVLAFLVSTLFTTGLGSTILTIFDGFLNNFGLLLEIALEAIIFTWIYSADKLMEVMNRNTIIHVGSWWKYLIKFILPVLLIGLWIISSVATLQNADSLTVTIEAILFALIIIIPLILYKLPSRESKNL